MQGKSATFKAVFHEIVALQSCATSRDRDPKALISLGSDGGKLQDRGFTVEDGSKVSRRSRNPYERDWNCQPMHSGCNTAKADGLAEWPKFRRNCHFLQVEDGHLFIRTRGRAGSERHLLLPNVVSPGSDKVDARSVVGPGKLGGRKVQGGSVGMKAEFGYMLPGIAAANVDWFNLHERARVELQIPKKFELTEEGRVIPVGTETVKGSLPDGDYSHFPSLPTPEGGLAVFGLRG